MSILQDLLQDVKYLHAANWNIDLDQESEFPVPVIHVECNFWYPITLMSEDDWHLLDNGYMDPQTGTRFYNYESDQDDEDYKGRFSLEIHGSDIPVMLNIMEREIADMRGWLTTLSGRDNPAV